jgi:hypothetical protein
VDWIYLVQGRKKWQVLMNMAMNISVSKMQGISRLAKELWDEQLLKMVY